MPVSAAANGSLSPDCSGFLMATSAATMRRAPSGARLSSSCTYSSDLTEGTRLPQTKQDAPAVSVGR